MRILMLAQFYPPIVGGEERHVRNLAQSLVARGHDVAVATLTDDLNTSESSDGPVRVFRARGLMQRASWLFTDDNRRHATPFPDPELTMRLHGIVREFRPDIVHAHNWIVHSYLPVKMTADVGLVLTLHDFSMICPKKTLMQGDTMCTGPAIAKCLGCAGAHYGKVKGAVTLFGHRLSSAIESGLVDRVVTVSRAVADGNRLTGRTLHHVIPNFIPDVFPAEDGHEARLAELPSEPYILFVGDLRRMKGLHATLEAYGQLRGAPPLVLIGRQCPDTPAALPQGVTALRNWPHGAVMHAWRRSLFGLVPSIWPDPCPTVALEAMASGKAVIGTKAGGIPDMIEDWRTGHLVAPGDTDALARAMQALIDDPASTIAMGARGRAKAKDFMAGSVVPRLEALYRDVRETRLLHRSKKTKWRLAG